MFNIEKMWESDNQKEEILNQIEHHMRTNYITKSEYGSDAKKIDTIEMKKYQSMSELQLISIVNLFISK